MMPCAESSREFNYERNPLKEAGTIVRRYN